MNREIERVILLGAGASYSYNESPTGLRPPLARDIIPTYTKLSLAGNRYVLVGNVINYVRDTRGIDPSEFGEWREDVENFLSEVDEQISILSGKIIAGKKLSGDEFVQYQLSVGAYNQLIFLFASIFNEIQNGPISVPYLLLCQEIEETDAIITFNWDTLLDRALMTSGKWSPSNGYLLSPEAIYDNGWKRTEAVPPTNKSPLYLKLHGSTNWLTAYHSPGAQIGRREKHTYSRYAMDKLYVFLQATAEYKTYEGRYWGPYEPFSFCYYPPNLPGQRDDIQEGWKSLRFVMAPDLLAHAQARIGEPDIFSMPLIVPPVRNKQYQRYGKVFSTLWSAAQSVLLQCQTLYIIGYSFPATDIATRDLFRAAIKPNKVLKKVVIVNPHPDSIVKLLIEDFGLRPDIIEARCERFEVPYNGKKPLL